MVFDKRAYALKYNASPHGKERRNAYKKKHPPAVARSNKKWVENNREKRRAQGKLQDAIRYGKITRPEVCSKCGGGGPIDAHHVDYSKPLEVDWCCRPCHVQIHKRQPSHV